MSFRKDVRLFMNDYYDWRKKKDVMIAVLKDQIRHLQGQNEQLMDRLLARDLPELKTFTMPRIETDEKSYDQLADENNAGEILNVPEEGKA